MAESDIYVIEYNRNRFPVQKRRPDSKLGCRGCGGELIGRRTAWCSTVCYKTYCPIEVKFAAKKRDKGICAMCLKDCHAEMREYRKRCVERSLHPQSSAAIDRCKRPHKEEYDHIIPFSEGGLTVLENLRSLCHECHLQRTKEWHFTRKKKN